MSTTEHITAGDAITALLAKFRLATAAEEMVRRLVEGGHETALSTVREVLEEERQDRWERRVQRLRKESKLPPGKSFDGFDLDRLPLALSRKIRDLASGDFVERAVNVLAFGLPGTGKTHAACALGHALVRAGHSVLFVPTFVLVQDLLAAKRALELPRALRKLDKYELLILDSCAARAYVQSRARNRSRAGRGPARLHITRPRSIATAPLVAPTHGRPRCSRRSTREATSASCPCRCWGNTSRASSFGSTRRNTHLCPSGCACDSSRGWTRCSANVASLGSRISPLQNC